ncbi:MAG: helix-turn-helix domain-containing protein [Pseudomonadota bacterium]
MSNVQTSLRSISTNAVPVNERAAYWREHICDVFVELDCETTAPQFHGEIAHLPMGVMQLSKVTSEAHDVYRSKRQLARTSNDCMLVSLQIKGHCNVEQDGRHTLLGPGDLVMYDSTRVYALRFRGPFEQLVLKIPRVRMRDHLASPERITAMTCSGQSGMGRLTFNLVANIAEQMQVLEHHELDRLAGNVVDMVGTTFAGELQPGSVDLSTTSAALLLRIKTYVGEHLRDPNLSRDHIAAAHGISVRYLNKLFLAEDVQLTQWIREQRLTNIARDLAAPQLSGRTIAEIAYSWGMNSIPHFCRLFKTTYGLSPRDYRARQRSI